MEKGIFKYTFTPEINIEEVESTLLLAVYAAEGLHGRSSVSMDMRYYANHEKRYCVVDATTDIGRNVCQIFTEYLTRELGYDSFQVRRQSSNKPLATEIPSSDKHPD